MISNRSSVDFTAWSSGLYIRIIPSPPANTQHSPRPDRVNMPAIAPNSLVLATGASGA
jgi:hypothetical protein